MRKINVSLSIGLRCREICRWCGPAGLPRSSVPSQRQGPKHMRRWIEHMKRGFASRVSARRESLRPLSLMAAVAPSDEAPPPIVGRSGYSSETLLLVGWLAMSSFYRGCFVHIWCSWNRTDYAGKMLIDYIMFHLRCHAISHLMFYLSCHLNVSLKFQL